MSRCSRSSLNASVAAIMSAAGAVAVGMAVMTQQCRQFVLETAGLDRAMHPALLGCPRFPPPAARARVCLRGYRAGARAASNGFVTLVVQLVVGNVVGADVIPHLFISPVGQRRKFDDAAMIVVDLDLADIRAGGPLIAAQARNPGVEIHQGAPQRQDLSHLATQQPQ